MFATDLFILDLVTRPAEVELRLSDARGVHLAARQTDLNQHPPALWDMALCKDSWKEVIGHLVPARR